MLFGNPDANEVSLGLSKFLISFGLGRAALGIAQPPDVAHPTVGQVEAPIGQLLKQYGDGLNQGDQQRLWHSQSRRDYDDAVSPS